MIRNVLVLAAALVGAGAMLPPQSSVSCDADNAGLIVPDGFCVTRFADSLQAPRHMVVGANGDLLIIGNARGGRGQPPSPGSIFLLRDANGDGKADAVQKLAQANGSGLALANGYLYATGDKSIVRYKYTAGATTLGQADTVVSGFDTGGHTSYNFVVVGQTIYMNVGTRSKCVRAWTAHAADTGGRSLRRALETRAGIWAFDANKLGQKPSDGTRFATGLRNSVALTTDPRDRSLWVTMHGRDGLQPPPAGLWPGHDNSYGAENPGSS